MSFKMKREQAEAKEGDSPKGVFNKGISFLAHLQNIEILCDNAAINNDFPLWFHGLQSWFNKLSGKLKEDEIDEVSLEFQKLEKFLYDDEFPDTFKKIILNSLQRRMEKKMDQLGYQMPGLETTDPGKSLMR